MQIAGMIDHTILKADATEADIKVLCEEALQYHFASVCVNSSYVPLCAKILAESDVKVCTVIGFPLGAMSTEGKRAETRQAVIDGAHEVDMVLPVGRLKSGDNSYVEADIHAVVREAAREGAITKVILETCLLTGEEIVRACKIACDAGAAFVKTSTGFSNGGALAEDIRLMRQTVGTACDVKASGGIRDYNTAIEMIRAGAGRIGTSSGIRIVEEASAREGI